MMQTTVGHPELECHATRTLLSVGSLGISARQGEARDHLQCLARKKLGARIGGGFGASNEGTQCTYALGVVPALAPLYSIGAFEGIDYFFGGGFGLLLIRFRVMRLGRRFGRT
jgi:hypothetical protein